MRVRVRSFVIAYMCMQRCVHYTRLWLHDCVHACVCALLMCLCVHCLCVGRQVWLACLTERLLAHWQDWRSRVQARHVADVHTEAGYCKLCVCMIILILFKGMVLYFWQNLSCWIKLKFHLFMTSFLFLVLCWTSLTGSFLSAGKNGVLRYSVPNWLSVP